MLLFFFFNDTATTEIYTLSLHDALPICTWGRRSAGSRTPKSNTSGTWNAASDPLRRISRLRCSAGRRRQTRSEEHTSELQSRQYLVCRLLLEKKKISSSKNIDTKL